MTTGGQYEVGKSIVACYAMTWLMYHSRELRRSPLCIKPHLKPHLCFFSYPRMHRRLHCRINKSSAGTEWVVSRGYVEKDIMIVYLPSLSMFITTKCTYTTHNITIIVCFIVELNNLRWAKCKPKSNLAMAEILWQIQPMSDWKPAGLTSFRDRLFLSILDWKTSYEDQPMFN